MKSKSYVIIKKFIILFIIISLLACQNGFVYAMSYGNPSEFTQYRPSGSGGGDTPITPSHPNPDTPSSIDISTPKISITGITGSVEEELESINNPQIGTETSEPSANLDYKGIPNARVTIRGMNNETSFTTTTNSQGVYQFENLYNAWGAGTHSYQLDFTYPNVNTSEIDSIHNVEMAKEIQNKLKYNGQDYQASHEKSDFSTIQYSGTAAAQVFLVLDCSGSMKEETVTITENGHPVQKKKIDVEKQIAKNIITSLLSGEKNVYIGLVVFTGVCYRRVGLTNNSSLLINAINGDIEFSDYGYTNIGAALNKANDSFVNIDEDNSNRFIFLLSDGLPTSDGNPNDILYYAEPSSPDEASIIAENNEKLQRIAAFTKQTIETIEASKVKIFSVIATQDLDENDRDMLNNIFVRNKNRNYNIVKTVKDISKVSKDITEEFEKFVKQSITVVNPGYQANLANRAIIKDRYSQFNYDNTEYFQALDMNLTNENLTTFKKYAKQLLQNTQVTVTSNVCQVTLNKATLPAENPEITYGKDRDGNPIVTKREHFYEEKKQDPGPNVYLRQLPQFTLTPKITITGIGVTASNGTIIDRQITSVEEAKSLISTVEQKMLYGSTVTLKYTITATNTSIYNDTKKVTILLYIPDGFDFHPESVHAVGIDGNNKIELSIQNITEINAQNVSDYHSPDLISYIRQGHTAVAITINTQNDDFALLTNGQISIDANVSKLLGNDDTMDYIGNAEILSYENGSYRRMQYKATSVNSLSPSLVAGNHDISELDYCQTANHGIVLLPTGKDKRMISIYLLLTFLSITSIFIIRKFKKSK